MVNIGTIVILAAAALLPSPAPAARATPQPDPCGKAHTNLLAALNRPTVGYSACAVKAHTAVAEEGYQKQFGTDSNAIFPQGFERFGLARNVEVDLIGPSFERKSRGGMAQSGALDSGVGAKLELWHNATDVAAIDLLYTVPSGNRPFTIGAPTQTMNVDVSHAITSRFSAAATFGLQSTAAPDARGRTARFLTLLPSVAITQTIGSRAQLYAEAFGTTRLHPDASGGMFGIDYGAQYMVTPRLEVDLEQGATRTNASRNTYYGFGFGVAF